MGRRGSSEAVRLEVRRSGDRFVSRRAGLTSRHSFSFNEHYDPGNVGFGPLLVLNEDVVELDRGYDDHPHADVEIVTWVLSGALQHVDSTGRRGLVYPRLAQRVSAGTGIVHAERNDGYRIDPTLPREPVHFVQMWLSPDTPGGVPAYAAAEVGEDALRGDWVPLVSGSGSAGAVTSIGTAGATLWVSVVAAGSRRILPEASSAHLLVARGELDLEAVGRLRAGDAVRIVGGAALALTARTEVEVLVWTFANRIAR